MLMNPAFIRSGQGGQRWLPLLVFALAAGGAQAAVDQDARLQLMQLQSQLQALESWRAVAQEETQALKVRYDGLHEVQRELNTRFLTLREQQQAATEGWTALRTGQQELGSQFSQILAQVQTLAQGQQQTELRLAQAETQAGGRGMVQLLNQMDTLNAELNKLRGKIEELGHGITTAEKRQRDMYLDLDTRVRRVEQNIAAAQKKEQESIAAIEERLRKLELAAQAQPAIPATVNTGAASEAPAPQPAESPQRTYEAAMNSYRASDYQGAIDGFTGFLRQYPQHALSANAQYWIGDAHFQLRDYKSAIEAQRKLLSTYPDSAKVPDALLNIGSAELGLGDPVAARKTWDDLIARHPSSDAADKARQRLSRLR
jgi:tol-pal system protein YbgF